MSNNGGPAFPTAVLSDDQGRITHGSSGLTLRDYFAAKAIPLFHDVSGLGWQQVVAVQAYQLADAMLKARES